MILNTELTRAQLKFTGPYCKILIEPPSDLCLPYLAWANRNNSVRPLSHDHVRLSVFLVGLIGRFMHSYEQTGVNRLVSITPSYLWADPVRKKYILF